MKFFKHILLPILASLFFLHSCTMAIIDEGDPDELPPITETIKYNPDVQTIMFNHCTTCHAGGAPSGGVDLTTYANVRFYAEQGNLISRINNARNPMPPSGLLPANQRQIIDKWKEDGFLEN